MTHQPQPPAAVTSELPTFDAWFKKKHGWTFEEAYMRPHDNALRAMRALSEALREYVSEMARG